MTNENEIVFNYTEKQKKMVDELSEVDEILWGGQAGGGKSEGLLLFALERRLQNPKSVGLMLRRTFRELDKSLIRKAKFGLWPKFAKWNEEKKLFMFPNGAIQEFGYLETDNDLMQYQSAEYDDICFDELTHFPESHYHYMKSRLRPRSCKKGLMRSATNPGNIGHEWVRAYFVSMAKNKIYEIMDNDTKKRMTRFFLPATLEDNTAMSKEERNNYTSWLNQLPENERRMLKDGDWDYVPGAAFSEWNALYHTVDASMPVPKWAKITMSFDFGFGKPFSCGWWWVDYDGRAYRFKEWYGWNGQADEGIRMAPSSIAKGIIEKEESAGIAGRIFNRISDPSIFSKTPNLKGGGQGASIAEMMLDEGIVFSPGDNDRLLGKQQFHERLKLQEDGLPMLIVYDSCTHFLRTVPSLQLDTNNIEDVNSDMEDHCYDEARYFLMSRPLTPKRFQIKRRQSQSIINWKVA